MNSLIPRFHSPFNYNQQKDGRGLGTRLPSARVSGSFSCELDSNFQITIFRGEYCYAMLMFRLVTVFLNIKYSYRISDTEITIRDRHFSPMNTMLNVKFRIQDRNS